jgi:hypothetical protein
MREISLFTRDSVKDKTAMEAPLSPNRTMPAITPPQ